MWVDKTLISLLSFSKKKVRISHWLASPEEFPQSLSGVIFFKRGSITLLPYTNLRNTFYSFSVQSIYCPQTWKCAKFNMDSFPLKLCRRHVMKNIHSSSNATVQVMEAGYFRTSGSSHKHRRPHHTNTTKESAFLWQMSTSHNSITFTTIIIVVIHCNNRNTVGLHFLQAFILWHVYRKNIYRIQKAYTSFE